MLVKRLVYFQPLLERIYYLDYRMKKNGTDLLYTVYACALEKVIIIISLLLTLIVS